MRNLVLALCMMLVIFPVSACSNNSDNPGNEDEQADRQPEGNSNILVVYFSQSGTTRGVAERIVELTGADTYRILAADPYEGDGYPDSDRIQDEAYNDRRPAVANLPENLDDYDTIFVGTPIWWHYPAMVVCTFLDNYDFKGKTIIPFCTYGATTWMPQTIDKIKELTPESTHLKEFGSSGSTANVESWLKEIGIISNP